MATERQLFLRYVDHDGDDAVQRSHSMSAQDVEVFLLRAHGLDVGSYLDPDDDEGDRD